MRDAVDFDTPASLATSANVTVPLVMVVQPVSSYHSAGLLSRRFFGSRKTGFPIMRARWATGFIDLMRGIRSGIAAVRDDESCVCV